ncbi:uncharacterized protein LOC143288929 [Babylonia areolata]|uniref:uncharacterized protein LOC143288929 n=1 Tax=Babylonia areolata TaxID=304850 RepID=UPI003FD1E789
MKEEGLVTERPRHLSSQGGEQGLYSELYASWQPDSHKERRKTPDTSLPRPPPSSFSFLQQHGGGGGASPDLPRYHDNRGFSPACGDGGGSLTGTSRDRPEVLKPEEYLSGLQTETYSLQQSPPPGRCGPCTRLVTSALVLMALAIVGLATALTVSVLTQTDGAGSEPAQRGYPVVRASMTLKILNKNFSSEMARPGSDLFTSVAVPYSTELDQLFLTSSLANVYRGNKVIALGPGSISARTELLFLDTGMVTKGEMVQDVIRTAERASQWNESDARAMGQFVVCSDCVTVSLNFTHLPRLPPRPVLLPIGSEDSDTANSTSTPTPVTQTHQTDGAEQSTTQSTPNVLVSNSTPFLTDGDFLVTCGVTEALGWSLVTLVFTADNSSTQRVLATVRSDSSPSVAVTADSSTTSPRLSAFANTSSDRVSLVVNVTDVTCADRGDYLCRVTMFSGEEFSAAGRVGIKELPSVPVINQTWSSTAWDATPVYTCSARLGYPPGSLSFSVVRDEHSPWERLPLTDVTAGKHCQDHSTITVSALEQALLGNGSRLVCQVFSEHLPLIDPSKYSAVLHLVNSHTLEIQTRSGWVNQGLAAIRCRLLLLSPPPPFPPRPWSRLTLLRLTSEGREEEVVTSLLGDGSVQWTDHYLRHRSLTTATVSDALADLSVFIFSLKCADDARYACSLQPGNLPTTTTTSTTTTTTTTGPQASLRVTAKPSRPVLTVPSDIFPRSHHPFAITCKAKVGRPAGHLVLSVKHPDETAFQELNFNEQTTIPLPCTTEARGTFYVSSGALRNGSAVSCAVLPHPVVGAPADAYDVVHVFNILPDALCEGQREANVSHPTDCHHLIHCRKNLIVSVLRCPDGFCFSKTSGDCSLPDPLHHHTEPVAGPCYPDKDQVTLPHPEQCTAFIQCHRGHHVIQHCPTAHLYVTKRHCASDVTRTRCYKELSREVGVFTNSTPITPV